MVQLHPAQSGRRRLSRCWFGARYYLSWVVFGAAALLVNAACAPFLLAPRRRELAPAARRLIRNGFRFWMGWLRISGVVHVRWNGFPRDPLPARAVYVANHPTLIDATAILSRLEDAVCVFKPALLRNPLIAPAARLAGYVAGCRADTLRVAAERVASGQSLLIFPEGTRTTPGRELNPLKPGFAVIARRAHAPVHVMRVRASEGLLPRGRAWWKLPPSPASLEISWDEANGTEDGARPRELVVQVAARLQHRAPQPVECLA